MAYILVIEDYQDNRQVVELILRDAHYDVATTSDGVAGVAVAAQSQPDLILMDLAMPKLDGWEATRRLKADPRTRHIPVVAFTAILTQDAIERALQAGCATVIAKPFEIDGLLEQIEALLARPPAQRAIPDGDLPPG